MPNKIAKRQVAKNRDIYPLMDLDTLSHGPGYTLS